MFNSMGIYVRRRHLSLPPSIVIVRADTGVCPYTWEPQAKNPICEQKLF